MTVNLKLWPENQKTANKRSAVFKGVMILSLLIINTHCQITPFSSSHNHSPSYSMFSPIHSARHRRQGETAFSFEIPITHNPFLSVWQQCSNGWSIFPAYVEKKNHSLHTACPLFPLLLQLPYCTLKDILMYCVHNEPYMMF